MMVKLFAADGVTAVGTIHIPYVSHENPPPYLWIPVPVAPARYFRREAGNNYFEITNDVYSVSDPIEEVTENEK